MASNSFCPTSSSRLFLTDRNSKISYLIDTGAYISVFPRKLLPGPRKKSTFELSAANDSTITTYGTILLTLNLGLRRNFPWSFVVADVSQPIIGADFIAHYKLLPDLAQQQLRDSTTHLAAVGKVVDCECPGLRPVSGNTALHQLILKYPSVTRPGGVLRDIKHSTKHHIPTTSGPPVALKARRLAPDRLKIAKQEFDTMLQLGIARPSKSQWASPLHMVPKADNCWRPCGDYRALNTRSIPDKYPVRYLEDFTAGLHGKIIFTTLDLQKAYHQIPVAEEDIEKTAIITPFGLFEFPLMSFGLRNAAQTFQRFMDEVLQGLDFCFCYIDDILIASSSAEEHLFHIDLVLQRLDKYGVILNSSKCHFGLKEIKFLGHTVSKDGISPPLSKIEAIFKIPKPTTAKSLRGFLGIVNFYRKFIPKAAEILAPLNDMLTGNLKGKAPITWTSVAEKAFDSAKNLFAKIAVLAHPQANAKLAIFCDASNFAIGGALHQFVGNSWQPLGFFSKKLSPAEMKYSAFDRELLSIYLSIKHFSHSVEGRVFTIFTDHKPLTYSSLATSNRSPRQARHLDYIYQFSTSIQHISGDDNLVADSLSRIESLSYAIDFDALAKSQEEDSELLSLLAGKTGLKLKKVNISSSSSAIYCDVSTSVIRPYVTKDFRRAVFESMHQLSHPGINATVKLISLRFVWPSIKRDCRTWAQNCLVCQRAKVTRHVSSPLKPFVLPSSRFEHVHLDIVIMPLSEGYKYCLTCVDRFTRWPEAIPLVNQEALTVAKAFVETWIARFGCPLRITTDQGRQFESNLFNQLSRLTGSTHLRTTAYHPAANGMVERFHRQLKASIKCYQNDRWVEILPLVLLGIRSAWKEDLKATSAELVFGEPLRLPGEFLSNDRTAENASVEQLIKDLHGYFRGLRPANVTSHGDRKVFVFKNLETAEQVFVRHDGPKSILQNPYNGPFTVVCRDAKTVTLNMNGKEVKVSIDRVKPAYVLRDDSTDQEDTKSKTSSQSNSPSMPPNFPEEAQQAPGERKTRAGRTVRFPSRFPNS